MSDADVTVIGSGMGGATVAAALAATGQKIVIPERGAHLVRSAKGRSDTEIFAEGYFRPCEEWPDGEGRPINPGNSCYAGANSKCHQAVQVRCHRPGLPQIGLRGARWTFTPCRKTCPTPKAASP